MREACEPNSSGSERIFSSLPDFLTYKSAECARIEQEARIALFRDKDRFKHASLLAERAQLIAGLPQEIDQLKNSGLDVTANIEMVIKNQAAIAREALDLNNISLLRALLIPGESDIGKPDAFQTLALRMRTEE